MPGAKASQFATCCNPLRCLGLQGLCRAIGVSNFGIGHLEQMFKYATIPPAVNQIELSPFLQRTELVDYCNSKDIVLEVCCQWDRLVTAKYKAMCCLCKAACCNVCKGQI